MAAQDFFGLDIGTSSIKVVQIASSGSTKRLVAVGLVPSPARGMLSESQVDQEAIANAIKKLVSDAGIKTSNVASALAESQIFTRVIEMPVLTDRELNSAIRYEAEQYIPVPVSEVSLAWKVLYRPLEATSEAKMDVLLIAAPLSLVEKHTRVLKLANLKPVALETEIVAMTRALVDPNSPTSLVVSTGAFTTDICIVRNGILSFTRSISTGGDALTRAIATELDFEQPQAEEYKKTYGLLEDQLESKILATLKPVFEIIVSEVKKSMLNFQTKSKGDPVKRVILAGGGAKLPGITTYLASELGLEVAVGDPWYQIAKESMVDKRLAEDRAVFAVSTGLAIRTV